MAKKTYAHLTAAVQQMVAAAHANQEALAERGMSAEFIQKGADMLAAIEANDVKQERLKAALKTATTQVEDLQVRLTDWMSEATKVVKLAFRGRQQKWVEFGVRASR
jgi:hypothetical protein